MKKLPFPTLLLSGFILTAALHPVAGQDTTATVTLNITTSGGASPFGAQVTLANHDGLPEHIYTAISPADGMIVFPDVFLGIYDLAVNLFGYQPYQHNNWSITQDLTLDILLLEITYPPPGLWVDPLTLMVYWLSPGPYVQNLFSETWDSGSFSDNEWTFDPSQGNWVIHSSNDLHTDTCARFNFWPEVTDYSYSLVSKNIFRNYHPIIWLSFDLSFSNFLSTTNENLAVEVWDGSSWTQVDNFSNQDYPEGIPWTTFTYNITDVVLGSFDIKVRFRAWGQDSFNINWWDIDNVKVRGETDSSVMGYLLDICGEVIETQDTSYQIPPSLLEWGETCAICVRAVYASGVSDLVCYYFTSIHLPPPRNLEGEDVGHAAHLTWLPPLPETQPHKSGGVSWEELLAYNHMTDADLYHPEITGIDRIGLPPPDLKPIVLSNPVETKGFMSVTSRALAYIAYSPDTTYDYLVKFTLGSSGSLTIFGPNGAGNFFSGGCWGPDSTWYVTRYNGQFGAVDTTTGVFTQICSGLNNPVGLAWNPTTGKMYMNTFGNGALYSIDPATGVTILVGTSAALGYIDLVCANDGQLYGLDINSQYFGKISKINGAWTPLIPSPFNFAYAQGMFVDRSDNTIYWAAFNASVNSGQLWTIDPVAGTMNYLGDFAGHSELDGMAIVSEDTVPWNLIGYNIYRDGVLIANTDTATTEYYDTDLPGGWYSYTVTASYSEPTPGESQAAGPVEVYIAGTGGIEGTVTSYGTQPEPIEGANITITCGDSIYITCTDATGHYLIAGIDLVCDICVEADGYETVCIEGIVIPFYQTIIIDFQLKEFPYPVLSVSAMPNEADTTVLIKWYPYQDFDIIVYDDSTSDDATAWDEGGNMNAVRFTPAAYPAAIYGLSVNIYNGTWPPGDILTPFKMAIYDDDGDYNLPGTELAVVDVTPYDYGWVYADFSNAGVTITNGDFYGVMIQGGDFPDCSPIAVDTTGHACRSYSQDVSHGEPWRPSGYNDFMIRAYIHHDMGNPVKSNSGQNDIQTPDFEYYKVYVLPQGEEGNPDTWMLKSDNLTQTSYTDTDWATYPAGWYRYAVIAEYTYNHSEPALSNPVEQVIIGINEPDLGSIKVYPVPAKDIVLVEVNNSIRDLKIINYTGQMVYQRKVEGEKTFRVNTSGFRTGSYLVEFILDDGKVVTRKMVIMK